MKLTTTYLEETSGANVYIDKEYQGSDDNALCVILGKHEQVSIAKVMIKEKLNQYNSANTFTILDNDGKYLRVLVGSVLIFFRYSNLA